MTTRLLQLSDLHLRREPGGRVHDVPTRATLEAVLRHIDGHEHQPELMVTTGDLADDGELEIQRSLRALLGERLARCRLVSGNQDRRESLRRAFATEVLDTH